MARRPWYLDNDAADTDDMIPTRPAQKPAQPRSGPAEPDPPPAPSNPPAASTGRSWTAPPSVNDGAGFLLAFFVWAWVVLPYFRGGTTEVKNVLRAKFTNRNPDGTWIK